MYPSRFRYEAPRSLDEAVALLRDGGDDAKVLAGGQSLVPLMKLGSRPRNWSWTSTTCPGSTTTGPTRTARCTSARSAGTPTLERSSLLAGTQPTMAAAAPLIADPIVRTRGTLVGSLCHADPQGDWAAVVLALGGSVIAHGPAGRRAIPMADFVTGPFQNMLEPGRDRGRGGHPGRGRHPLGRLPEAGAPGRRLRHRRGGGRAGVRRRRRRAQGRHRADRRGRVHDRGHRGRRRAHRPVADGRNDRRRPPGWPPRRPSREPTIAAALRTRSTWSARSCSGC